MSRVLIVTDDKRDRDQVHSALSVSGNELIDHPDPESAAARAAEESADVAVVDLQVGSMGGMAVARDFRSKNDIPVVLLLDREADTFIAGRSGAKGWVTKPFTAAELRSVIENAVNGE